MKKLILALALLSPILYAEEVPMCPEPMIIEKDSSCLVTMPGCLKSKEDVDAIIEGIQGCPEQFPDAPCLIYAERDVQLGFKYHCGLPE